MMPASGDNVAVYSCVEGKERKEGRKGKERKGRKKEKEKEGHKD